MREIVTDVIVKILMGILVIYIAPALKRLIETARKNKELSGLIDIADVVVRGIQQKYWDKDGTFKKEMAIKEFINIANERGIKLNPIELDNLIESAVHAKNEYKNYNG